MLAMFLQRSGCIGNIGMTHLLLIFDLDQDRRKLNGPCSQ